MCPRATCMGAHSHTFVNIAKITSLSVNQYRRISNTHRRRPVLCHRPRSRRSENRPKKKKVKRKERKKKNVDLKYQVKQYVYYIVLSSRQRESSARTGRRGGQGSNHVTAPVLALTAASYRVRRTGARCAGAPQSTTRDALHNHNAHNNVITTLPAARKRHHTGAGSRPPW